MAKFCQQCGSPLNENGQCPNCTHEQPRSIQQNVQIPPRQQVVQNPFQPPRPSNPPKRKNAGVIAFLAVLLVMLLTVGALSLVAYLDIAYIPVLSDFFEDVKSDDGKDEKDEKEEKKTTQENSASDPAVVTQTEPEPSKRTVLSTEYDP